MIRLRSRCFSRPNSKLEECTTDTGGGDIKWELRPGGMLVQRRENGMRNREEMIRVRVSVVSNCHHISIQATSTFGEMKLILSMITGLEPQEQRLLYRGKERDDDDFLHMVGVKDMDKVLLLEDPARKERKLNDLIRSQTIENCSHVISV